MAARAALERPPTRPDQTHNCMETPVRWILNAQEQSTAAKVAMYILTSFCCLVLCLSLIGIPVVWKGWQEYQIQVAERNEIKAAILAADAAEAEAARARAAVAEIEAAHRRQPAGIEEVRLRSQVDAIEAAHRRMAPPPAVVEIPPSAASPSAPLGAPMAALQPPAEPRMPFVPGALTAAGIALRESRSAQNAQPGGAGVVRQNRQPRQPDITREELDPLDAYRAARIAEAQERATRIRIAPVRTQAERDADPFATVLEDMAEEHELLHPGTLDPLTASFIGDGQGRPGCIQQ